MDKYRRLREHVANSVHHTDDVLLVPSAATDEQLLRCHSRRYVEAVKAGLLSKQEIRRIGFPWTPEMVERSRRSTGATIVAAKSSLVEGVAANLAGGTHHAFADAGEGYCVFNDAAVAIRTLQSEGAIERACVIDLDVHQGNGTASILDGDDSAFTLSIHGEKNFPLRKCPSNLDVNLPDGCGDDAYLAALEAALAEIDRHAKRSGKFDLAIYLAGADPFSGDRLGRLRLSKSGLARRDFTVFDWARARDIPVAVTMSGGYAPLVDDIVSIHANTLKLAKVDTLNLDVTL